MPPINLNRNKFSSKDQRQEALSKLFPVEQKEEQVAEAQRIPGQRDITGLKMITRDRVIVQAQFRKDAKSDVESKRENIAEMRRRGLGIEGCGIISPLVVRPDPERSGYFILVAGERRYWASEGLLDELPCLVTDSSIAAARIVQGIENVQRKGFSILEEVEFVSVLRNEMNLSLRVAGEMVGLGKRWVENRDRLAHAGPDVKETMSLYSDSRKYPGVTLTNMLLVETVKKDLVLRKKLLKMAIEGATEAKLRDVIIVAEDEARKAHKNAYVAAHGHLPPGTPDSSTSSDSAASSSSDARPSSSIPENSTPHRSYQSFNTGTLSDSAAQTPTFGQNATPEGIAVPRSVEIKVAADGDLRIRESNTMEQFVQSAGSILAECARLLEEDTVAELKKDALDRALDVVELQIKRIRRARGRKMIVEHVNDTPDISNLVDNSKEAG